MLVQLVRLALLVTLARLDPRALRLRWLVRLAPLVWALLAPRALRPLCPVRLVRLALLVERALPV